MQFYKRGLGVLKIERQATLGPKACTWRVRVTVRSPATRRVLVVSQGLLRKDSTRT